jgi:transglutaminase-like putative cysteine protease
MTTAPPAERRASPATIPGHAPVVPPTRPGPPPVYLLLTLIGAVAILAATTAIPPMISGASWFLPILEVVMVIWLVGVGARLARVPAAAAIVLQILAAAVALTALFTTGGIGGVIPNGAVIGEFSELLDGAWEQIRNTVSPAPASVELNFLITLSVGVTALVVDILIAVCRAPALVALPLLCVYSVPASIDLSLLPWEAFAAPAMLYALLLTASGLTGRRIGAGAGSAQVFTGVVLASVAIVVALVAASAVTGVGTAGRLPRTTAGPSSLIGLSPFASLRGSLTQTEPVEMLRVSGLDKPRYLRTYGLQIWTPGEGFSIDELAAGPLPDTAPGADARQISVTSVSYSDKYLPIYGGTQALGGLGPGWSYDAALETVHRTDALVAGTYQITAAFPEPSAADLRGDSVNVGGALTETGELSAEVTELTAQITAGATSAFDKADALRKYFTDPANGFTYSLTVPEGNSGDALVDFLRNKQGYCEQYASAMAIMLRAAGVPARVGIGFTQGTAQDDGTYVINSNDAHAWVEVPFDRAGWVEFDPTPLGGGQGGQQGFVEGAETTTASSAAPSTGGSLEALDEPTVGGGVAAQPTAASDSASAATSIGGGVPAGVWWVLGILVLTGAALAGPNLVRNRRRTTRLTLADAGGPGAAAAAWREIEDLAVDHGIALNAAESARATANRLAKAAHLSDHGRAQLRSVVTAAELDWYAPVAAGEPGARLGTPINTADRVAGVPASPDDASAVGRGAVANGGVNGARRDGGPLERTAPVRTVLMDSASRASDGLSEPASPGQMSQAARTMATELDHQAPLKLLDRLFPRSVRPTWWRESI